MADHSPAELRLTADRIAYVDEALGCNVASFIAGATGFFLSANTQLEEEALFNTIYSEYDGQENGRYDAVSALRLGEREVLVEFRERMPLMGRYRWLRIALPDRLDRTLVDFLYNRLFLGDLIIQDHDDAALLAISQTATRAPLD